VSEFVDDYGHPIFPVTRSHNRVLFDEWNHQRCSCRDCEVRHIPAGRYLPMPAEEEEA
jgi:hypothetical protein